MTNKELQLYLQGLPSDMEVLLDRNGCVFTEIAQPIIKFMGTKQEDCIVLYSPIKMK